MNKVVLLLAAMGSVSVAHAAMECKTSLNGKFIEMGRTPHSISNLLGLNDQYRVSIDFGLVPSNNPTAPALPFKVTIETNTSNPDRVLETTGVMTPNSFGDTESKYAYELRINTSSTRGRMMCIDRSTFDESDARSPIGILRSYERFGAMKK